MQVRVAQFSTPMATKMQPDDDGVVFHYPRLKAKKSRSMVMASRHALSVMDDLIEALVRMMNNENGFIGP